MLGVPCYVLSSLGSVRSRFGISCVFVILIIHTIVIIMLGLSVDSSLDEQSSSLAIV